MQSFLALNLCYFLPFIGATLALEQELKKKGTKTCWIPIFNPAALEPDEADRNAVIGWYPFTSILQLD